LRLFFDIAADRFLLLISAGEAGIALESPDQKTQGLVVQIALPR
jgi:hypothetical protein